MKKPIVLTSSSTVAVAVPFKAPLGSFGLDNEDDVTYNYNP